MVFHSIASRRDYPQRLYPFHPKKSRCVGHGRGRLRSLCWCRRGITVVRDVPEDPGGFGQGQVEATPLAFALLGDYISRFMTTYDYD